MPEGGSVAAHERFDVGSPGSSPATGDVIEDHDGCLDLDATSEAGAS
jgi:hypothetical protein